MPFLKERTAATYAKEILRVWTGSEIAENAVVDGTQIPLNGDGRRILETGTVMVYAGVSERQTVTITGSPAGGTVTLTVPADSPTAEADGTVAVVAPYNATGAAVQALYEAAAGKTGDVTVTGAAGGPWVFTFGGDLRGRDIATITRVNGLTGGTSPDATIATNIVGGSGKLTSQMVRPAPASGVVAADVAGVVMKTTEFWPGETEADKDDAAVALFTLNCHFASDKLLGYSGNVAAVESAMTGSGNGRCANCTFA